MFVVFVDLQVEPGSQSALEKTYTEVFRPAITRQEGFRAVELLRPNQDGGEYRLSIAFENQPLQRKWVVSDLHQQVWPQIEAYSAGYSVKDYSSI